MRLTFKDTEAHEYFAYLDGKRIPNAIAADDSEGWLVTSERGGFGEKDKTERKNGLVQLYPITAPNPELMAAFLFSVMPKPELVAGVSWELLPQEWRERFVALAIAAYKLGMRLPNSEA